MTASTFDREAILAEFVTRDVSRPDLTSPWNEGHYCYASDGRSLVQIPGNIQMTEEERVKSRPRVGALFDEQSARFCADSLWLPLSSIQNPIGIVSCDECKGTGLGYTECLECMGKGEVLCSACGYEHECEDCGWLRRTRQAVALCGLCKGCGTLDGYAREVDTPCGVFQGYLLARVARLPLAEFHVPAIFAPLEVMVIRFRYGRCLLMPYRVDDTSGARTMHAAVMEGEQDD